VVFGQGVRQMQQNPTILALYPQEC